MKKRKKMGWISLFLLLALPVSIYYFLRKNDAPILHGKVDFCIAYKNELLLDIYEPTQEVYSKRPVLVYYHGGAWVGGNKVTVNNARFHGAFNALREKGYAIISPAYTLAKLGKSPFPDCIADAFDVLSWIENNAETYNFDLNNVGVLGESAGGHLALMTAFAEPEKFTTPHGLSLKYVAAIYPPTDLHKLYDDQQDLIGTVKASAARLPESLQSYMDINQYLFGFDPKADTVKAHEFTQLYSPINYVKEGMLPTLIIHGDKDRLVPISQSLVLKDKLEANKVPLEFHSLEGVDHAFVEATETQKQQVQSWIEGFVVRYYE